MPKGYKTAACRTNYYQAWPCCSSGGVLDAGSHLGYNPSSCTTFFSSRSLRQQRGLVLLGQCSNDLHQLGRLAHAVLELDLRLVSGEGAAQRRRQAVHAALELGLRLTR